MSTRVVVYCRVSTEAQAAEGVSLEGQVMRARAWCQAHGFTLPDEDIYSDRGLSGKRADNRPGLAAALDAVTSQSGAVLVVYSLSRLARSIRDTLSIAEKLAKASADLVSLSEDLNTASAAGKMIFRLLAVLAEFERDLISERTRAGLAVLRARNERIGQVPYGKRLSPDGKTLETDPAELDVMRAVRGWRAAGWSLRGIARELDARKIPTKNGGPAWSASSVRHLTRSAENP